MPLLPKPKAQLQDYHSLHIASTMIFNKTLVTLIAAFAAASGVAASVATVPRDNGSFPPPNLTPIPIGSCNLGSAQCCNTVTSTSNPAVAQISGLLSLGGLINPDLGVGLSCLPIPLSSVQW
jgi:hypothetical protein